MPDSTRPINANEQIQSTREARAQLRRVREASRIKVTAKV